MPVVTWNGRSNGSGNTSSTRWPRQVQRSKKSWIQSRRPATPGGKQGKRAVVTMGWQSRAGGRGGRNLQRRRCPDRVVKHTFTSTKLQKMRQTGGKWRSAQPLRRAWHGRPKLAPWCALACTDSGARGNGFTARGHQRPSLATHPPAPGRANGRAVCGPLVPSALVGG